MKLTRLRVLTALLLASVVGFALLFWLKQTYLDEGANYSRIEDGLYIGGHVKHPPRRTRAVLNLCEVEDPYRCDVHLWEPIPDAGPAPELAWLRRMVEFVDAQ